MTDTMDRTDHRLSDTDDDDEIVAHIVKRDDQMRGYFEGKEITALCGTKWVPCKDYQGLPVCQACVAELARLRST